MKIIKTIKKLPQYRLNGVLVNRVADLVPVMPDDFLARPTRAQSFSATNRLIDIKTSNKAFSGWGTVLVLELWLKVDHY